MAKGISIVIPTDVDNCIWLKYCVQSIKENVVGYDEIVIVDVDGSVTDFEKVRLDTDCINREFLNKSYAVMQADVFVKQGNDVCVWLPNFLMCRRYDLRATYVDGKPTILCDTYASLSRQTGDIFKAVQNWQTSTESVIGKDVDFEFARTNPIIYPYFIFEEIRAFIKDKYASDLPEYLNAVNCPDIPEGFCFNEYNVLGAYLYSNYGDEFVNWVVMSQSRTLTKYHIPVIGLFDAVIDTEDIKQVLLEESQNKEYSRLIRAFLKKIALNT